MQWGFIQNILIKAFGQDLFDVVNGWVLAGFLITSAASGILGVVKSDRLKKIINLFENNNDRPNT